MSRQKKQKEEEAVVEAVEEEECGPIPITKLEVRSRLLGVLENRMAKSHAELTLPPSNFTATWHQRC